MSPAEADQGMGASSPLTLDSSKPNMGLNARPHWDSIVSMASQAIRKAKPSNRNRSDLHGVT